MNRLLDKLDDFVSHAVDPEPAPSKAKKTRFGNIEVVECGMFFNYRRIRIPGGWLLMAGPWAIGVVAALQTANFAMHGALPDGLVFVPDPNHEWDGLPLPLIEPDNFQLPQN